MNLTVFNPIRELNPQLLRELKGRLKPRNIAIAIGLSIISQFVIVHSLEYRWFDIFIVLSLSSMAAILAIGTYMLICDLDEEERRGTLNFLRLTPQSATRIFIGKLLGVPCVLYLAVALAIPLQFWAGFLGGFDILEILGFDILLIFRCIFVLSIALLLGLIKGNLVGLKPWIASAVILLALFMFSIIFPHAPNLNNGWDGMKLISPSALLPYFLSENPQQRIFDNRAEYYIKELQNLRWFYLPIGATAFHLSLFYLANYIVWIRLTFQGIERLFQNPTGTIISKRLSYWITACFTMLCLGFSIRNFGFINYQLLLTENLFLFLGLIVALTPHRSTVQDWLQDCQGKFPKKADLISDLVWAEKSPAIVAIAVNLGIASIPVGFFTLFIDDSLGEKAALLLGLFVNASFILLSASLAQLMLLMKNRRRALWTTSILSAILIVPPTVIKSLANYSYENPAMLILSSLSFLGLENASFSLILITLTSQILVLAVLNKQLTQSLKRISHSPAKVIAS